MKIYGLSDKVAFSPEKPIKRHFLNAKGFHAALICLKAGTEIPPHPEDYGALLVVIGGRGIFTDANGKSALANNQAIYVRKGEIRGIKAEEDLVILGIQDREKGGKQNE